MSQDAPQRSRGFDVDKMLRAREGFGDAAGPAQDEFLKNSATQSRMFAPMLAIQKDPLAVVEIYGLPPGTRVFIDEQTAGPDTRFKGQREWTIARSVDEDNTLSLKNDAGEHTLCHWLARCQVMSIPEHVQGAIRGGAAERLREAEQGIKSATQYQKSNYRKLLNFNHTPQQFVVPVHFDNVVEAVSVSSVGESSYAMAASLS